MIRPAGSSSLAGCAAALGLLLAMALPGTARAVLHQVSANPNNTFTPETLVIQPGDSVKWTNLGGLHNVLADDASFRCSNGCADTGQTGEPSSGWTFTRTFPDPKSIPYHCEVHTFAKGFGMRGLLIVALFNDGFEDASTDAWSEVVP